MKKLLAAAAAASAVFMLGGVCYASQPLGDAVYTDIVTYINHVPIQSHCFNGRTLIAVEDLQNFGFDVYWNEYKWTLTLTRNHDKNTINVPFVLCPAPYNIGLREFTVTTTDVKVNTGDFQYTTYGGVDGYTFIDVEDLKCFDGVTTEWVPDVRALKVWIDDGLEMYSYMLRAVPAVKYYNYYPSLYYRYYWEWYDMPKQTVLSLYMLTDDGCYVDSDYAELEITDVIDADGKSILKSPVKARGTNVWPYVYGWTEGYLSSQVVLTADDLTGRTAQEEGGIIKFKFTDCTYSSNKDIMTDSIRVEQLPYYK